MTAPIVLDRTVSGPLHLQIATRLRTAITTGVLAPGARLPSARSLAEQLGVARGTVDAGYAVLIGEGVVVPPELAARAAPPAQRRMPFAARRAEQPGAPLPFRMGLPALDAFPRKLWT